MTALSEYGLRRAIEETRRPLRRDPPMVVPADCARQMISDARNSGVAEFIEWAARQTLGGRAP